MLQTQRNVQFQVLTVDTYIAYSNPVTDIMSE